MALIYAADVETARMQVVADKIDAGTGPGKLEIGTTGFAAVIVSIPLADPCGTVSGDTLTLDTSPAPAANASAAGVAAEARIVDSSDGSVITGLVVRASADPDAGEEVVLINTNIAVGQPVSIQTATVKHA